MSAQSVWRLAALLAFTAPAALAQPVSLSFVEARFDGEGSAPLANPEQVAISPDSRHAYVASRFETSFEDDGVAILSLDGSTSAPTYIGGVFFQRDSVPIAGALGIVVSPDGAHVYVAAELSGALSVFARDAATGGLTFIEAKQAGEGDVPGDGLGSADRVAISADGATVYAVANFEGRLAVFDRDPVTGALTFVQAFTDGEGGVAGLDDPTGVQVSPDGAHVYVSNGNGVTLFSRDAATGALTLVGVVAEDGVGGADGLAGTRDLALSADGAHVYVTSTFEDAVAVFARTAATGDLAFVQVVRDGVDGVDGIDRATEIALSADGANVYVTGRSDNAVAVFSRDGATGTLTFVSLNRNGAGGGFRLNGAFGVAVSPDGNAVVVTAKVGKAASAFRRDTATGTLTFVDDVRDGDDGGAALVLRGAQGVALSPDDRHVYVAAGQDSGLTAFARDESTGALAFVQSFDRISLGTDTFSNPSQLAVSPDGQYVYVAAIFGNAVNVFARDEASGVLTFLESVVDGAGSVDGIAGVNGLSISPDGAHLYTASAESALAVFSRDAASGGLTFVELERDGVNGVDGLNNAYGVMVSPDGAHVYATSRFDNAVSVFAREAGTGALTFVEVQKDGVNGADGLQNATGLAVSPDGAHVFVTGTFEDALAVFSRDAGTGALTFVEVQRDNTGGVDGLDAPFSVAVSPDGSHVFATGGLDNALAVFARDVGTGALTFVEVQKNGVGGVEGLGAARAVAVSRDGRHEYVAAFGASGPSGTPSGVSVFANSRALASGPATTVTISGDAGWRMLAPPTAETTVGDLAAQNLVQGIPGSFPTADLNLFTGYTGTAYTAPASTAETLAPGRGLFWYLYDNEVAGTPSQELPFTLAASGAAVTTDTPVPLHAAGDRFNLVGNPFGEPLDVSGLAAFAQGGALASAVAQVYDPALPGYRLSTSPELNSTIAVWQGFFVENGDPATAPPAAALVIPASARTTGGTFYRTERSLVAFALDGQTAGGAVVRDRSAQLVFDAEADAGWDLWDATKLSAVSTPSVSLAVLGDRAGAPVAKAQESRALEPGPFEVPFSVDAVGTTGALVLSWPHMTTPEAWRLTLRDMVTGAVVDLRQASSYAFAVDAGTPASGAPERAVLPIPTARQAGDARFVLRVDPGGATPTQTYEAAETALGTVVPNPFSARTEVRFSLAEAGAVTVTVHDLLGREIARLTDSEQPAGDHAVSLDARGLASGVYVVRMTAADGFVAARRVTVIR